jgi:Icc-related predicted phosphoesterase
MKILYATDLHGNRELYKRLLDMGTEDDIKAIIIGGDINPGFNIQQQRNFLHYYLIPALKTFRNENNKEIYIIMGNDDFAINMDLLHEAEKSGILKVLHNRVYKIFNMYIVGYSFINPSPFMIKDWEKPEHEISLDLGKILIQQNDLKRTICVMHAPPFNTKLDILYNGMHVGSEAIRKFIENKQPYLTMHGHIHESYNMSGEYKERIGNTICINPGAGNMIVFDLENLDVKLVNK